MKVIEQYEQIKINQPKGVALGNFDGIHIAHQKLIHTLIEKSQEKNLESCVFTFNNHPTSIITGIHPPMITDSNKKKKIFESLKLDTLIIIDFDKDFMALQPDEFVKKILVKTLNCKIAVVGFDYRFGYRAGGDVQLLKELGKKYGFEVIIVGSIMINGIKVSSTAVRQFIMDGNLEKANEFLGRYYSLQSKVIHGDGRGSKLGYPTANLLMNSNFLLPKEGVYATFVKINEKIYKGATSIGSNPTFGGNSPSIETYIINFEGSLYDQYIEIFFVKRLRDQRKFDYTHELIQQIEEDVENTKKYLQFEGNMLK